MVPINDIRGLEGMGYTKAEKALRCKLAACYRLVDMYGLAQSIYNHITVRISQDTEHFLLNPFGKSEICVVISFIPHSLFAMRTLLSTTAFP